MKTLSPEIKFYSIQQGTNDIYMGEKTNCLQFTLKSPNNIYISVYSSSDEDIQKRYINLKRIKEIKQLKDNWDGYDAKAFSADLLNYMEKMIGQLEVQPNLFPLSDGAIQLEMHRNGCAIEIEINEDEIALVNIVDENNKEITKKITNDFLSVNEELKKFYAHKF